jgi:hypothetical protein
VVVYLGVGPDVDAVRSLDEERLVRLIAGGDRAAFDELYRRTSPWLAVRRVLPTAVAMARAVVTGYLCMFAAGAGYVGPLASYFPVGSVWIVVVGALSMVPAVWLGLAIGSRLPSALTPPVLAVAGVPALLVAPEIRFHASRIGGDPPGAMLLLPSVAGARTGTLTEFLAATARTHLTQALWLTALAATGLAGFSAASRRAAVAAVLPAALGAALAVLLLPGRLRLRPGRDRPGLHRRRPQGVRD